ncbi:hypothetical protein FQN54_002069 [Arachnomyces sp. PD_36]|nr:hypothetical protein FQN54_002069 [Arachnomyces sp. PD_36]
MQLITTSVAFALFAALVNAAPNPQTQAAPIVTATFHGADADASFQQDFISGGNTADITNDLSITYISVEAGAGSCTFYGVDGSVTTVNGGGRVPVGPPQTQISGSCHGF